MRHEEKRQRQLQGLSVILAISSFVVPAVALVGWAFNQPFLESLHPNLAAMSILTAVLMMVGSGAVLLLHEARTREFHRLGLGLGALVAGVAAIKWADGRLIPEIFGNQYPLGAGGVYPLAMSDYTAIALLLAGLAIACIDQDIKYGLVPSQFISMTSLFIGLFVLIGYVYDVRSIVSGNANFPMALNAALGLVLLNLSILLLRPNRGPMVIYLHDTPGGDIMRRLSPIFLLLPFLLGGLRLQGERAGLYEAWFGVALMTALMTASFLGLTWWGAFKINRKEEEYQALAEHSPDIIARFDREARHLYVNQAIARYAEQPPEAFIGKTNEEIGMPPEQARVWRDRINAVFREAQPSTLDFAFASGGTHFYFQSRLVPELELDGSVQSVLVVTRDVTEMRSAFERLKEADKAKAELLGVVSHELRTPLNFIMGFVSFLQDGIGGDLNPEQQGFADKAMEGAERLLGLVDDLLDYTRLQSGSFEIEPAPTPYDELLATLEARHRTRAEERGIALTLEADVAGRPCVDARRIGQVLDKLLDNAFNFTPDGGSVAVRAYVEGPSVVTEVRDSGIGIPADKQKDVFTHFKQVDMSSTRAVGGLGLGLAISKGIVEVHGGAIGVESTPGQGATFWFRLPLTTAC